jgi:putative Ca2+/H+ antiporter (TMEM165/GDT1 family)
VDPVQVGLTEALAVIFAAEIGDKTFFVAIILAMRYRKSAIMLGCMTALTLQAIISAAFGAFISQIDHQLLAWAAGIIYCKSAFPS